MEFGESSKMYVKFQLWGHELSVCIRHLYTPVMKSVAKEFIFWVRGLRFETL